MTVMISPKIEVLSIMRSIQRRWLLRIKQNGIYHEKLVAFGYSQIQRFDFSENYFPVVNDITCRILLSLMLTCGYDAKIVDMEQPFFVAGLNLYEVSPRYEQEV